MLYGIFPVIAGSSVLCMGNLWWMIRAAKRFKGLQPGVKVHKIYKFEDPHDVERLSRAMRKFDIDGEIVEEAAELGETIIKAGMQTFPKSPFLLILYANFLLEVRKDGPASRTQLQLASKLAPGLVERYQGEYGTGLSMRLAVSPTMLLPYCTPSVRPNARAALTLGLLACNPSQDAPTRTRFSPILLPAAVFCTNEASKRLKDNHDGGLDLQAYIEFKRNYRSVGSHDIVLWSFPTDPFYQRCHLTAMHLR